MLFRALKSLWRTPNRGIERAVRHEERVGRQQDDPPARYERLDRAHAAAPLATHLDLLYGSLQVGDRPLLELLERTLAESNTASAPNKTLHRPLASFFLVKYFLHALPLGGLQAECGVFRGASALFACRAAQAANPAYRGDGFHLIDSFEGLAAAVDEDRFVIHTPTGDATRIAIQTGFAASQETVRGTLKDFPGITYHQGWIPNVFSGVPDARWSFVHLDVDHYAPTYACLEYFHPRMVAGGVIVCDDYGSPLFPGAQRAWDRYCDEHALPYVVLDTGQSVFMKV